MALYRGIEVGKMIMTEADVLEAFYPEMHARLQAAKNAPVSVVSEPPKPVKVKKATKAEREAAAAEPERTTLPAPEPEQAQATGYDPFKD